MPSYKDQLYGYYYTDAFLEHHGVIGQKWGIRRFQNDDGSFTPFGKRRAELKNAKESYKSSIELANQRYADRKRRNAERSKEEGSIGTFEARRRNSMAKQLYKSEKKLAKLEERNSVAKAKGKNLSSEDRIRLKNARANHARLNKISKDASSYYDRAGKAEKIFASLSLSPTMYYAQRANNVSAAQAFLSGPGLDAMSTAVDMIDLFTS